MTIGRNFDIPFVKREVDAFMLEYRCYLKQVKVDGDELELETLEGTKFLCRVSEAGWEVSGSRYPTSQAMMSAISPSFRAAWSMDLMKKLEGI